MKNWNHSTKVNALFGFIIAMMVLVLFFFNGITLALTNRFQLYTDLTSNQAYEISADTKEVLSHLSEPVDIYVLSTENEYSGSNYLLQAKRIIQQYGQYSDMVNVTFVDYSSDPSFAAGFPDLNLSKGDLIIQAGDQTKHIIAGLLFNYSYDAQGNLTIESSRAEEAITSAIMNVTSGVSTKVAILTGNGTTNMDVFNSLLVDNNYSLQAVNLTSDSLDGYDVAVLVAPVTDLSEEVVRKIESFLTNNGNYGKTLLYFANVNQTAMKNWDTYLKEWGVSFYDGAVFETVAEKTYQYQPYYPLVEYEDNQYTDSLKDSSTPLLMPLARPMEVEFTSKDNYYVQTLLSFSESSGVRPADAPENFDPNQATIRGPIPAMVLSTYYAKGTEGSEHSQILISSSMSMLEEICLQNTSLTNAEYLMNILNQLSNREDAFVVAPKSLAGKTLGINTQQIKTIGTIVSTVIPVGILACGFYVWFSRRNK